MASSNPTTYLDYLNIHETDDYLEIKKNPDFIQGILTEKTIFEVVIKCLTPDSSGSSKKHFATRQLIDFYTEEETNTIKYVKANNFTFFTKLEYLSKIGVYYNFLKSFSQANFKVALFLSPGISFHCSLLATNLIGAVPTVIHSTLATQAIYNAFIETSPEVIILDQETIPKFLSTLSDDSASCESFIKSLKFIIFDYTNMALKKQSEFPALYSPLKEHLLKINPNLKFETTNILTETPSFSLPKSPLIPKSEDETVLIIYTSGTSKNKAKGVLISNKNLVSAIDSICIETAPIKTPSFNYLSFLPAAHIYEHVVSYVAILRNGVYAFGNAKTLTCKATNKESGSPGGDIVVFQPSVISMVPLVAQRLKTAIESAIKSKGSLTEKFYRYSVKAKKNKWRVSSWIGNSFVFNKIHSRLGGNLQLIVSGGAALEDSLKEWLENVCLVKVIEGYALTESTAGGLLSNPLLEEKRKCFVGTPSGRIIARIYKEGFEQKEDGDIKRIKGVLKLKGDCVAKQYISEGNITDKDGWFNTGDVVQVLLPNDNKDLAALKKIGEEQVPGIIRVIGRDKELIKMSNGEYYNLIHYEEIYKRIEEIDNCMICLEDHMRRPGLLVSSVKEIDKEKLLKKIEEVEKERNVNRSIFVERVEIVKELWTQENDILTPTLKLRRFKVMERYKEEYERLVKKDE